VTESKERLSLEVLQNERKRLSVSRPVLVNRLKLLGCDGDKGPEYYKALSNVAVGTGEWTVGGRSMLRSWPLFVNFDRNIVPAMFLRLAQASLAPAELFFPEGEFVLCGGTRGQTDVETDAGIPSAPNATKMRIQCEAESTSRRPGSTFLYVIRRRAD